MADKQLTEAGWKAFTKGKSASKDGYKDAALLKALAAFEKAERGGADAQLEALDDIDKQAEALRKLCKADKELGSTLDEMLKSVAKERKTAEQAKKAEASAAASEADDEEDSPALLTGKMLPLIRQVKKGDVVLQALVAVAGKDCAVLLSRKSISAARRKLMSEYLGNVGGIKYIKGECLLEAKALTFVVVAAAGGLAKKIKAALLAQTELRLKVRVRGEDPHDIDEEGEDDETADAAGDAAARGQAAANGTTDAATGATATATATAAPAESFDVALGAWRAARGTAITTLKGLAAKAAALKQPDSVKAVIEVSAVVKQLSAEPRTAQQVAELIRYVNEDDVVFDVCDLDTDIRTPMMNALDAMRRALAPSA